jgi:glucose 1-dehydrogenase
MKLEGKNALVTGGGEGIGKAISRRLAAEGANVVVNYLSNRAQAEAVCAEIEAMGRRSLAIQADVGNPDAARKLAQDAIAALGWLDILANNAGIEKRAPFAEIAEADYFAVMQVNLHGPFFLTQAFVQDLLRRKRPGKIINISSVHEELPFPHFTPYCMSKGALKMMMRNLAVELAPHGITVNNIAPGAMETPINRNLLSNPALLQNLLRNIPLRRMGQPADVANAAAFLASSEADYITGATTFVDGGLLWNYSEQ